jgi:hypothetical protein
MGMPITSVWAVGRAKIRRGGPLVSALVFFLKKKSLVKMARATCNAFFFQKNIGESCHDILGEVAFEARLEGNGRGSPVSGQSDVVWSKVGHAQQFHGAHQPAGTSHQVAGHNVDALFS